MSPLPVMLAVPARLRPCGLAGELLHLKDQPRHPAGVRLTCAAAFPAAYLQEVDRGQCDRESVELVTVKLNEVEKALGPHIGQTSGSFGWGSQWIA